MSWLSSAWHWYAAERALNTGAVSHPHAELLNPIVAFIGAVIVAGTAIANSVATRRQARAATRQAETATQRHAEQTSADRQRRITESFAKAVEQLGSDKLEVRVGAIYSLERISRESLDEYWTVIECLTAFVRERTQRTEEKRLTIPFSERVEERLRRLRPDGPEPAATKTYLRLEAEQHEKELGDPPELDIDAVLTVLARRHDTNREAERRNGWRLNLEGAILRQVNLRRVHLENAILSHAHLEGADLEAVELAGALLRKAKFTRAGLRDANLERTSLGDADLTKANLRKAQLKGAWVMGAHFEGADLRETEDLTLSQLHMAYGDADTQLTPPLTAPRQWFETESEA